MVNAPTALAATYGAVTRRVTGLDDDGFGAPSRCAGWSAQDLLFHLLLDAQRALVVLARPGDDPADTDAVSYWRPFGDREPGDGQPHAAYVRRASAAYASTARLLEHWTDTCVAAAAAAAAADLTATVRTQGHVLTAGDFVETLVVEATLHLLDLQPEQVVEPPPAAALALTRSTLERLLGAPLPDDWDDVTAALRLTGRSVLTATDRTALGGAAGRVPVLQ